VIEEKDIDTLIKAKRDEFTIQILMTFSALTFVTLIVLEALSIEHEYTILLATLGMVFLGSAIGQNRWVSVSRAQLIDVIERIISSDADALKMLAQKKGGPSEQRHE
jgi:NAD(P)H-hydrate repair Nnr-like enzyme with NAD(P)H-hydrate dehydratase domain